MKLKGAYKGTRKRHAPPALIIIECPACGFRTAGAKPEEAEMEYVLHINNVHSGPLECAFCPDSVGRGLRYLPDFATLAAHVHHFHAQEKLADGRTILEIDPLALPPGAFK